MADRTIHLEGMGVLGSLIGRRLRERGVPFRWHDTDRDVCAWRACTGGIYPSGIPSELSAYLRWQEWAKEPWADGLVEPADFWFLSKKPPHGGHYAIAQSVGPLRLGEVPSYHLNAQQLVERSRDNFAAERGAVNSDETVIVTHGYGPRLDHYLWGWHVKVHLRVDRTVLNAGRYRPCFYLRTDRFTMFYAYPVPNEPGAWYAGSSTIVQRLANRAPITPRFQQWSERIERATSGLVAVEDTISMAQGWRPCPVKGDEALVARVGRAYHVRPMSHSGVRLAPHVVDAVLEVVG